MLEELQRRNCDPVTIRLYQFAVAGCSIRRDCLYCRRHRSRWAPWNCARQERPLSDGKGFQSASDRSCRLHHHPLGRGNLVIWRKVRGRARLHAVAGGLSSSVGSSGPGTDCYVCIVDMCIPQPSIRVAPCRNLAHPWPHHTPLFTFGECFRFATGCANHCRLDQTRAPTFDHVLPHLRGNPSKSPEFEVTASVHLSYAFTLACVRRAWPWRRSC